MWKIRQMVELVSTNRYLNSNLSNYLILLQHPPQEVDVQRSLLLHAHTEFPPKIHAIKRGVHGEVDKDEKVRLFQPNNHQLNSKFNYI